MNNSPEISLWGPSIRTDNWLEIYESLKSTNSCSFKIFFCGQVRPSFTLPEDFVYIHSSTSGIAPHAEIARRAALKSNSEYILSMVDDLIFSEGLLDGLISDLNSSEKETVTGPAFIPDSNFLNQNKTIREIINC